MPGIATTILAGAILALSNAAVATESNDTAAIEQVLEAYEQALNSSDTDAVLRLYAPDGVFMPQYIPSSIGADAVRNAYWNVFSAVKLSFRLDIAEIVQVAPEWAFARTNSAGTVTVRTSNHTLAEAIQQFFVLQKLAAGGWKIAHYSFASTTPPRE
ncbi:conserved hypothetical protein [Mesorhizobium albiziae]|uniref:SnoaL-like domain-containing protein n=1 Tax=Neomesorhizobium albiziae TaxID=335020 RepID=A0A1I4D8I8_9HYPH|nr:SgcJ/EcaC family oxidoreductase [Mesorhizobium albiziae]GLS33621.1 hypothetical protein GCM10007937_53330 [Mesorhizobium albiziae]SFK89179.1 conserved hypothetical protein [Mesorhizobium albiziae]